MLLNAREQVIASVCSDLFWRWMAREPAARIPLNDESANALLITCLCNRQIGFRAAEAIVPELKRRSGMSNTLELFTSHNDIMLEYLMFDPSLGKSVHRFHYFARYCHDAIVHIRDKYDGSALNMFADTPLGSEALRRVTAIRGFGSKTGSLWLRLCTLTYGGCELFDGYQGVMPADDRWVRRVGSQLGLWAEDASFTDICEVAKRLSLSLAPLRLTRSSSVRTGRVEPSGNPAAITGLGKRVRGCGFAPRLPSRRQSNRTS